MIRPTITVRTLPSVETARISEPQCSSDRYWVRLPGVSVYVDSAAALTRNGRVGMYGSGWVSLLTSIRPLEYEPSRIPSLGRRCEQVSTQTRSPRPRCCSWTISSGSRSSDDACPWVASTSSVTSPTRFGVNSTPSEPRSSTPMVIFASSMSSTTVTIEPLAWSAAASRISSGILLGSCRNSTSVTSARFATLQATSRVCSSSTRTSTPVRRPGRIPSNFSAIAWSTTSRSTTSTSRSISVVGVSPFTTAVFVRFGGIFAARSGSSNTTASTPR